MNIHHTDFASANVLEFPRVALPKAAIDVALVMPCYNEALRLDAATILNFLRGHRAIHLILVNDGSTDATLEMLLAMSRQMPDQISVVDLPRNGGKAEAVRQGLLHALDMHVPFVAYWDADLATPLEAVEDFVRVAKRHDEISVMFGSRRQMLGHRINRTLGRKIISRTCSTMARMALGLPIADTQCGAKLFRTSAALQAAVSTPFTAGWLFDVELFARVRHAQGEGGKTFYEFPLPQWNEVPGSKISGRAVVKAGLRMVGLIAEYRLGLGAKAVPAPNAPAPKVYRCGFPVDAAFRARVGL